MERERAEVISVVAQANIGGQWVQVPGQGFSIAEARTNAFAALRARVGYFPAHLVEYVTPSEPGGSIQGQRYPADPTGREPYVDEKTGQRYHQWPDYRTDDPDAPVTPPIPVQPPQRVPEYGGLPPSNVDTVAQRGAPVPNYPAPVNPALDPRDPGLVPNQADQQFAADPQFADYRSPNVSPQHHYPPQQPAPPQYQVPPAPQHFPQPQPAPAPPPPSFEPAPPQSPPLTDDLEALEAELEAAAVEPEPVEAELYSVQQAAKILASNDQSVRRYAENYEKGERGPGALRTHASYQTPKGSKARLFTKADLDAFEKPTTGPKK